MKSFGYGTKRRMTLGIGIYSDYLDKNPKVTLRKLSKTRLLPSFSSGLCFVKLTKTNNTKHLLRNPLLPSYQVLSET